MFKVIALPTLRSMQVAYANGTIEADSRICAAAGCTDVAVTGGVPRTDREWTALVQVASGETDILASQCARLVALGLIERVAGAPSLTVHGRLTLGLAD